MKRKRLTSLLLSTVFIVTLIPTVYVSASQTSITPDVQLGWSNSMLLKGDGTLWGWGANWSGKLGVGNTSNQNRPTKILDNVISFSASTGGSNGAAIKTDGSLWIWGDNGNGQLGNGTYTDSKIPIKIMDDVVSVSLGEDHGAAIKADRSLWTWGDNGCGQLGDGTTEDHTTPIKIMDDVKMVSLGYNHSAAIKLDGSLYTWGSNQDGGLGNGQNSNSDLIDSIIGDEIVTHNEYLPQKIMDNVKMVSLGRWYGAAIKNDGSLWTWGDNDCGQLGDGTYEETDYPIKIMENVKTVALGAFYSAVIKSDNSLWLWGSNYAKATSFAGGNDYYQLTPIKVMDNVFDVSFNEHCAVIKKDGSLWMWGCNDYGQLGDGTYKDTYVPFKLLDNVILPPQPQKIKVLLNDEEIEFDQPPVMINDRVMVPIRAVAEKMGDTVKWSSYLNSALIVHADRMVIFKNNSEQALIYADPTDSSTWSSYYCDVPPQVINNRTLTPVRAIGECLGAKVDWDGNTQTVIINYDKNTPHTLKDNAFKQLNAYYSSLLQASDFTTYSDEINEFYNSRSNWADAFIIFWDDWTISLDILASGEKTNVYMLKNCFAEILSEIPDSDVKDFDVYTEILDWLSKTSKLADIDFTKVDKVVNISVQTANSLSKFGNAIDRAGIALDFTGVGIDVLAELLSDYSTGMLYIDTLRNSFKYSGIEDEVIYTALDELENDYVNKCASTLIENATSMSSSALLKLITSGAFNVASFGKDILNWVVDNDDKADAVKNINCIYLFNEYIDKAYSDVRNNLITDSTEIDDYIRLFNFQKIVKTKMYESMDRLRKKSDQYTQTRITEQLDKLKKSSYIIWE